MAWLGREEGMDWWDWGLGVRKWVSPSVLSLGLGLELELRSMRPFPHPPTSGTRVCLLLLCAGVLQGRPREDSLIGVGWHLGTELGLKAGTPGTLCYGAGSQQEVSPRVRGARSPRQEVSDS